MAVLSTCSVYVYIVYYMRIDSSRGGSLKLLFEVIKFRGDWVHWKDGISDANLPACPQLSQAHFHLLFFGQDPQPQLSFPHQVLQQGKDCSWYVFQGFVSHAQSLLYGRLQDQAFPEEKGRCKPSDVNFFTWCYGGILCLSCRFLKKKQIKAVL